MSMFETTGGLLSDGKEFLITESFGGCLFQCVKTIQIYKHWLFKQGNVVETEHYKNFVNPGFLSKY